jgi:hypothetical protein
VVPQVNLPLLKRSSFESSMSAGAAVGAHERIGVRRRTPPTNEYFLFRLRLSQRDRWALTNQCDEDCEQQLLR